MNFDEIKVEELYQESLNAAYKLLASLTVAEGREPRTGGLSGWVFEKTIRYCLCHELKLLGLSPEIEEQVKLHGRVKIDLLIGGKVAIEIKALGSFGDGDRKYRDYRTTVEEKGWVYLYLTRSESYKPYRSATTEVFGIGRAFFLDSKGDWERFVNATADNLSLVNLSRTIYN